MKRATLSSDSWFAAGECSGVEFAGRTWDRERLGAWKYGAERWRTVRVRVDYMEEEACTQ